MPDEIGEEEYVVASTALEHFAKTFLGGARVLVVNGKTAADDRLRASVDRVRHPEPEKPKVENPELRRQTDPEKRERARRWMEDWARMTLQDDKAFAQEASDQTILDWTRRNYASGFWADRFPISTLVVVFSEGEFKHLKGAGRGSLEDFWSAFRENYPEAGAIISISRVGFNAEHTQAIIEVGYATGPLGGEGDYVLLDKENGVWKVQYLLGAWIS